MKKEKFPDPLDLELQKDGFHYKLLREFRVIDGVLGKVVVPVHFITDLGSIPRIFWNIIPPNGKPTDAYVIHDYLYAKQNFPRVEADICLLRMMESLDVSWFQRWIVYLAVRLGGWIAWKEDREKRR
jgi:hypothetical protein